MIAATGEGSARRPTGDRTMLSALRYYWVTAKGYRLRPWLSPYLRWRMETFFGEQAGGRGELDAGTFFRLLWRERAQLYRFLRWADQRRREQRMRD